MSPKDIHRSYILQIEGNFLFHSSGRKCGNLVARFVEVTREWTVVVWCVRNNCDSLDDALELTFNENLREVAVSGLYRDLT